MKNKTQQNAHLRGVFVFVCVRFTILYEIVELTRTFGTINLNRFEIFLCYTLA